MEALVAALADRFEARGLPLQADPKRSVSRIYRDTRFAKDKSPYKSNIYARFPWVGRGSDHDASDEGAHGPGGYFSVMPGESYVGGGMWMPEKPRLDAFRAAILDEPDRVRAALEDPASSPSSGRSTATTRSSACRPASHRTTRWPSCSGTRT